MPKFYDYTYPEFALKEGQNNLTIAGDKSRWDQSLQHGEGAYVRDTPATVMVKNGKIVSVVIDGEAYEVEDGEEYEWHLI